MKIPKGLLETVISGSIVFLIGCSSDDKFISIGFFGPLTGNTATAGQALRNGALIATQEINSDDGLLGRPVRLIEYDDRSSPEQAARVATKLVLEDEVTAIVGSLHSGNILAAAPILELSETPTVGSGTSPSWLEQGYKYLFRSLGNSRLSVSQLVDYATRVQMQRIAIMFGNDEYGTTGAKDFEAQALNNGLEIVARESFTHGDRDFTGQYARILGQQPDGVLLWGLGDDLGFLIRQLRQSGYSGPVLGSEGFTMRQVLDVSGSAANGVVVAAQYLIPETAEAAPSRVMRDFLEQYYENFGSMPASDNAFRGYDAVKILAEGIRRAGSLDRVAIRNAIQDIENFQGIAGEFTFKGHTGEGIHKMQIYYVQDGKYLETAPERSGRNANTQPAGGTPFLQLLIGGLLLGSLYALIALGYSLIYSASGLMTFVQGEYFMLGAFISYTLFVLLSWPFVMTFIATVFLMMLLGMLTEKLVIGPLLTRGSRVIHIVLVTIGLSIFLRNFAMLTWGTEVYNFPSVFGDKPFRIGTITLIPQNLWIVFVSVLSMVVLHAFLHRTKLGLAMRAAAQNKTGAATLGINVPFTVALTWGIAAALAGAGGMLVAPIYGVSASMGILVGLKGFAAAVVGGYGSMTGAILGGLFLGLVETFAAGYISSTSKDIVIFGVLLLVLFFLPRGFLRVPILK
jgi:branched-subunit amino acid ABC-type transport system permease component